MKGRNMVVSTLVMGLIAVSLLYYGHHRNDGSDILGLKAGFSSLISILPLLLFAFIIVGMMTTLITSDTIERYIGANSGFKGIMIGTLAGALTPAGPIVSFPIAAGMLKAHASLGSVVSYTTAWAVLSLPRLFIEVGIVGLRFTLIRIGSVLLLPLLAGLLADFIFGSSELK